MKLYYDCRPLVLAKERLTNYRNLYLTSLKSTFSAVAGNTIHLPLLLTKSAKLREIARKFELIAVKGHRSWCQSKAHIQLPVANYQWADMSNCTKNVRIRRV